MKMGEPERLTDDGRTCPKCGKWAYFDRHYLVALSSIIASDGMVYIGPCMVRTCGICGYSYSHPPNDMEKQDGHKD